MATLEDFENKKIELFKLVDSIHNLCETSSYNVIQMELNKLKKKVHESNDILERFLNDFSNIEKEALSRMKDSLQEVIVKLESSVCVPEFCINRDVHGSCQFLTKKLIDHLQEITFCYDLSDMPRATNKGVQKKKKSRANSLYESIAPSESELIQSIMRKRTMKCKRRHESASSTTKPVKSLGRFSVTYPGASAADNGATATVGKKKGKKGKGKPHQSKKKKRDNSEMKNKSKKSKKKSKN